MSFYNSCIIVLTVALLAPSTHCEDQVPLLYNFFVTIAAVALKTSYISG
jgi:hypothetical protein